MAAAVNKLNESMKDLKQESLSSKSEGVGVQSHHRDDAVSSNDSDLEQRQPEEDSMESSDASSDELEHSKATLSSADELNGYDSSETYQKPAPAVNGKAEPEEAGKHVLDAVEGIPKYQYAKSSNKKFLRSNDMLYFKIKATNVDRYVRENNVAALEMMAAASYMATLTYADSKLELVVIGAKATKQIVQSLLHLKISQPSLMFYLTRKLNNECHNVRMTVVPEYARQMICSDDLEEKGDWKERSVLFNKVPPGAAADLFEVLIPGAKTVYRSQNRESCFVVEFASPEKAGLFMKACTEIRLQQHPLSFCLASRHQDYADEVDDGRKEKPRKRKISTKSTDSSEVEEGCTVDKVNPLTQEPPRRLPPPLQLAGLQDLKKAQSVTAPQQKVDALDDSEVLQQDGSKKRKFERGGGRGSKGGNFKGHNWGKGSKGHGGGRGSPDSGYGHSPRPPFEERGLGGSGQEPLLHQQMALLQQNMTFLTQAMMVQGLGLGGMGMGGGRGFFPGGGGGGRRGIGSQRTQGQRSEQRRNWGGSHGGLGRQGGFQDKRGRMETGSKCWN